LIAMPPGNSNADIASIDNPSSTSSSLLERAKTGDEGAWERLVAIYGPSVYEWCRRAGLHAEDAADVAQDVFGSLVTTLPNFRRDRPNDSFRAWLRTVTQNKIRDFFRRQRGKPLAPGGTTAMERLAQLAEELSATENVEQPSDELLLLRRRAVEIVRAGVEERTWEAFWRVVVEGRPASDVAAELGISPQAVYDAKYRLQRKLRQELDGLTD